MSDIETLTNQSRTLLEANRRHTNGHQYTVPSPQTYPYQWLWDSCFHAIVLSHFDITAAKEEIYSLLSHQFENGMVPHMIYWDRKDLIDFDWGKEHSSSITQPPMLAYAIWAIYQKEGDEAFLEDMYPHLFHFYNYLLIERDTRHHHLAGIINPDESGEDTSPRFDVPLDLPAQHTFKENLDKRLTLIEKNKTCDFDAHFCMKNFFWIKDVPFNAILIRNLEIFARIAETIGKREDALYYTQRKIEVEKAMRERMFFDGIFWSIYGREHTPIRTKTWAIFAPLFANILTQKEAEELVHTHLRNSDEFNTPYGVPTTAVDEDAFAPDGFADNGPSWRGPTWIATNWFIYRGLLHYNLTEDAFAIREKSHALIKKAGFREHYNPLTGAGLGAKDFTWGTLVLDMYAYEQRK